MLARRLLLTGLLLAAGFLRLGGLDHGVGRGSPAGDEQHNFVAPILGMWSAPGADRGVRPGYPGFFNYLAFFPVVLGETLGGETGAYVAARGLVAAFGVLNVFLAYRLCGALAGPWPGVFAAGLLTFSRGEVSHAHYVTPDLVVISGVFLVLLVVHRRPLDARTAALAGALCGLTVAVKYTGVVAVPAVAAALLRDRLPLRPTAAAAASAAAAFALAAPFALLGTSAGAGAGIAAAVRDYYSPTGYAAGTAATAEYAGVSTANLVAGYLTQNVGPAGLALAAAGLALFRPAVSLAPAVAALAAGIGMVLPAQLAYPRHVLVPSALLAVLAGCGLHAAQARLMAAGPRVARAVAAGLALLAVASPAPEALALGVRFSQPDALDQAGTWIEKSVPGQPLVAAGYPRFVLAPRFEVRTWARPADVPLLDVPPAVLRHYDLLVAPEPEMEELRRRGLPTRRVHAFEDGALTVAVALPEPAPVVPSVPTRTDASDAAGDAAGAWSGSAPWRTRSPAGWISAEWDHPRRIRRVDVVADATGGLTPQGVVLEGRTSANGRWRRLAAWMLRPRTLGRLSPDLPAGQVFVLDPPADVVALRLVGRGDEPWGLSHIRVLEERTGR